jgi:hypothetical protein
MTQRTKTTFIVAILYSTLFSFMLGIILYVIHVQGTKLGAAKEIIAEQSAKELAYTNVMRVLAGSKVDRAKLDSYFMSEKDTISFISELETAAKSFGISMQTTGLSVAPAATVGGVVNPPVLSVGVQFKGSEQSVKKYISLLENIPYHKHINTFSFTGDTATGEWVAVTTIAITMKP